MFVLLLTIMCLNKRQHSADAKLSFMHSTMFSKRNYVSCLVPYLNLLVIVPSLSRSRVVNTLFSEVQVVCYTLPNRMVMAPRTRSRADDDVPNDLVATYYRQRVSTGLIISEGVFPVALG